MLRRLQRPASGAFTAYVCPSCRNRSLRAQSTAATAQQSSHAGDDSPILARNGLGKSDDGPGPQEQDGQQAADVTASLAVGGRNAHRQGVNSNSVASSQGPARRKRGKSLRKTSSGRLNRFRKFAAHGYIAGRLDFIRNVTSIPPPSRAQLGRHRASSVARRGATNSSWATRITDAYKSLEKDGIPRQVSGEDGVKAVERDLVAHLRQTFAEAKSKSKSKSKGKVSVAAARTPVKGVRKITAASLELEPVTGMEQPPVPRLHHGLDRVLFNPGVYQLQDPRTRLYNFDPYLHKILPVDQFNFKALQEYETSSQDQTLGQIAADQKMRYYGSTSSMTGMLRHFHFLLSQGRPLNFTMLTQAFEVKSKTYSRIAKIPAAVFLRYRDEVKPGRYAIDADKFFDGMNIMSLLGHSLEKLLTCPVAEFEEYRLQKDKEPFVPSEPPRNSYHYTKMDDMLMRSQLDAADPRLPGTGVFDVKTRAVVSVRAHAFDDHRPGLGYELLSEHGQWESFEREQYDMLRTTMLSYSLQARMGRMDGIFAAYHNIERIFGFQYFGLEDLDLGLHGQRDRTLGDQEFKISLALLKNVFDKATKKFPKQTLRMHFEARGTPVFLYVYVEPLTEDEANAIQDKNKEKNKKITRSLLYPDANDDVEPEAEDADAWAELRDKVESDIRQHQTSGGASVTDSVDESEQSEDEEQFSFEHRLLRLQVSAEKIKSTTQTSLQSLEDANASPKTKTTMRNHIRAAVADLLQVRLKMSTLASRIKDEQGEDSKLMFFVKHIEDTLDKQILEVANLERNLVPRKTRIDAEKSTQSRSSSSSSANGESADTETEAETENDANLNDAMSSWESLEQDPPAEDYRTPIDTSKPLLAMTVAIRNKVNDEAVKRPENFTESDHWAVEYRIDEVQDAAQAWSLYAACQERRAAQLAENSESKQGLRIFQNEVRGWARKGKAWRAKQDEEDQKKGVEVFEAFDQP